VKWRRESLEFIASFEFIASIVSMGAAE